MRKSEKNYLDRVSQLGCVLCRHLGHGATPAEIHHIEIVRGPLTNYLVAPLCPDHHRGSDGVHGLSRRGFEMRYKLSEMELIGLTIKYLEEMP